MHRPHDTCYRCVLLCAAVRLYSCWWWSYNPSCPPSFLIFRTITHYTSYHLMCFLIIWDYLLCPDRGRSAFWAERPILIPAVYTVHMVVSYSYVWLQRILISLTLVSHSHPCLGVSVELARCDKHSGKVIAAPATPGYDTYVSSS